jgi:hypothetical protein
MFWGDLIVLGVPEGWWGAWFSIIVVAGGGLIAVIVV